MFNAKDRTEKQKRWRACTLGLSVTKVLLKNIVSAKKYNKILLYNQLVVFVQAETNELISIHMFEPLQLII